MAMNIDITNTEAGIENVLDHQRLSEEERAKRLQEVEDKQEALREARSDISKIRRTLRQIKQIYERGELSETDLAKAQELINYLNEVLSAHQELYQELKEQKNSDRSNPEGTRETEETTPEEIELEQDSTNGAPVTINGNEMQPDQEYTYYLRAGRPVEASQAEEEEEAGSDLPPEEGTENDPPSLSDDPEIDDAMDPDSPAHPDNTWKQPVTLNFTPDQEVTLFMYDPENETFTLRVTDSEGNVSYLKFINAFDARYVFRNGFRSMEAIQELPEKLQKMFIQSGKTESFYERLNGINGTPEAARQAMDLYPAVTGDENYDEIMQYLSFVESPEEPMPSNEQMRVTKERWKKYSDILFDHIRELNKIEGPDKPGIHRMLLKLWKEKILEDMKDLPVRVQSNILIALITSFFKKVSIKDFQSMFGYTAINLIEDKLVDLRTTLYELNETTPKDQEALFSSDKLAIMLLENFAYIPGQGEESRFGGSEIFLEKFASRALDFGPPFRGPDDYKERFNEEDILKDPWKDYRGNVKALEQFKELTQNKPELSDQTTGFTAEAKQALAYQHVLAESPMIHFEEADRVSIRQSEPTLTYVRRYADALKEDRIKHFVRKVLHLLTTDKPVPAYIMAFWVINYMKTFASECDRGATIGIVMMLLKNHKPSVFKALIEVPGFAKQIHAWIDPLSSSFDTIKKHVNAYIPVESDQNDETSSAA